MAESSQVASGWGALAGRRSRGAFPILVPSGLGALDYFQPFSAT
ncbi:hypothetical protein [Streptomyces lunaelactis]|nr:hypothetical protein [Streptomyces lunaelactis]